MKFVHTADLHLGKTLNDVSFLENQVYALAQIAAIAREENADAVLIAGDVYQKASPPSEAMAVFDRFITELAEKNIKVFIISGNHDSSQRISYFSALIRESGVHVSERFEGALQQFVVKDAYGEVVVHLCRFSSLLRFAAGCPVKKSPPIRTLWRRCCAILRLMKKSATCCCATSLLPVLKPRIPRKKRWAAWTISTLLSFRRLITSRLDTSTNLSA